MLTEVGSILMVKKENDSYFRDSQTYNRQMNYYLKHDKLTKVFFFLNLRQSIYLSRITLLY